MSATCCPRCGAPQDGPQTDPLARCPWCGALLAASAGLPALPMVARVRIPANRAIDGVRRELAARGEGPAPLGMPRLVWYPFEIVASSRRPFRPLAPLPPPLASGWRPSGADLVRESIDGGPGRPPGDAGSGPPGPPSATDGIRIPVRSSPSPGATTVHYPFWRVPVDSGTGTALWVDAIDGQVIDGRPSAADRELPASDDRLGRWAFGALAAGALAALLVPFPWSLLPLGLAGTGIWRGGWRR